MINLRNSITKSKDCSFNLIEEILKEGVKKSTSLTPMYTVIDGVLYRIVDNVVPHQVIDWAKKR